MDKYALIRYMLTTYCFQLTSAERRVGDLLDLQ